MEGKRFNNEDSKGKAKAVFQEGKGSENKDPKKEKIVEASSSNPGVNNVAEPVDSDTPSQPIVAGAGVPERRKEYQCHFCNKKFSTAQALGGHQNGHRYERECAKRLKTIEQGSPNYEGLARSLTLDYPRLPLPNDKSFIPPQPPVKHPYPLPIFPNIQYPESITRLTLGHPSQHSGTLSKSRQSTDDTLGMMMPYPGNNGNFNPLGAVNAGRQGGNSNSMGRVSISQEMVGGGGNCDTTLRLGMPVSGNSRFPNDGNEAAGTSGTGIGSRNIFGLSLGISSEADRDTVRGNDGDNRTINLLSRLGKDSREVEENKVGDRVNGENES